MPRSPFLPLPPALLSRMIVLPLLTLALSPLPALADKTGAGWQQHKGKSKFRPKNAPAAETVPDDPAPPPSRWRKGNGKPDPAGRGAVPLPEAPPEGLRRTAPEEEMVQRSIPGNGPLYEDDLIRLAIANNHELARRRTEILVARAKIKGAGDWENPELRIGYTWDRDDRLREPFVERGTETITSNERYRQSESTRSLEANPFGPSFGDNELERTSGSLRETRYRTIETRVTPGRYKDVVERTVYEDRRSRESYNRNISETRNGITAPSAEGGAQNTDRRIVERSREVVRHPDAYQRDDELSLLIRFRIPNPWERRANIELAAAETARAESDYLLEEDKVIRDVRALYEDLNMFESVARGAATRRSMQEKFGGEVEAVNAPELADLAADIRLEVGKSIRDQRELRSDIARLRQELAAYCGLNQPERIGVLNKPTRRIVQLDSLDLDYLISMAQLHRSDLLDLEARHAMARAELKATKAARIPFFSFIDAGWATAQTSGRTGENEEWMVRAGITLPFFEWTGINKAHLEHQTATEAYGRQIEQQRAHIASEIRAAVQRIRAAAGELATYEADLGKIKGNAARSIETTAAEPIKNLKTRYQNEELVSQFEQDRYEVWSDYYKAVIELERALGTRLERVLTSR